MIWITSLLFVLAGMLFGLFLDRILLKRFLKLSARTEWRWDDILVQSISGFPVLWCFLAGLYGAIVTAPIELGEQRSAEKVLLVVTIISVTVFAARLASTSSRKTDGQFPAATILTNLSRVFIYILGLLTIFYTFGINITPALTALGIGGIAVALALQDTLSNFFAGLQIIASKQISTGNLIKISSGEEGHVTDITWRNTTVQTLANNLVVIPNSKLASEVFMNYSLPETEMAVVVQAGVSYNSDLNHVERVTIEVASEVMQEAAAGVPEFQPAIRYHTFGESSILFNVVMRTKEFTELPLIRHEFIKKLHARYKQENIEIPYPIRKLFLNQQD